MEKGLFLGLTTIDIFNTVAQHPTPNQKIKTERQDVCAGGPAANAAVAFAAFGHDTHLCCGLGFHPTAEAGRADLKKHGVSLHECSAIPNQLPVISSILINTSSADRCVIYADPSKHKLSPDFDYQNLTNECSVLLFDGFYPEQALSLAQIAKDKGIPTVLDGGSWKEGLEQLLPFIDYAICSDDFYPPGCLNSEDTLALLSRTVRQGIAISRGADSIIGCLDGQTQHIIPPEIEAVDTLGAGDILHGAFCHYIIAHPFMKSLQLASKIASLSCCHHGTREWIKHL